MMHRRPLYTLILFLVSLSATIAVDIGRRRSSERTVPVPSPATPISRTGAATVSSTTASPLIADPTSTVTARAHMTTEPPAMVQPPARATAQPHQDSFGTDYAVIHYPAGSVMHGHGLVVIDQIAYTIDGGQLRALPLQPSGSVRTLTPPGNRIDNVPVKDWIDVAAADNGDLWLIDRMGDVVRYTPAAQSWRVERKIVDLFQNPSQLYVALASYAGRAYILDESQGQVWRWPLGERDQGYFGGLDVWQRIDQGVDITRAVDLAVDGNVYLLLREEPEPAKQLPARIRMYQNTTMVWEQPEGLTFERPLHLYTSDQSRVLYVIDRDGSRVQELDKASGKLVGSLSFGTEIRAIAQVGERLYLLGRDRMYVTPGAGTAIVSQSDTSPRADRPDDPALWTNLRLLPPIEGAFLPDRDSLLPAAPRLYRFGVHEGIDFFGIASGTAVQIGTPVLAAADGTVIRADTGYVELTPTRLYQLLDDAAARRNTPAETEDLLRGRSVCIQHSDAIVTCYAHLSRIASEIKVGAQVRSGEVIAYAGNSGSAEGVHGSTGGVHLHFEVHVGNHYLGRWLSPLETRRLLGRIFGFNASPPVTNGIPLILHDTHSH